MDSKLLEKKTDLTNYDREPIHILGSVQSHRVLLTLKEPEFLILQVSENISDLVGLSAQSMLNQPLDALLETSQVYLLKTALLSQDVEDINPIKLRLKTTQGELLANGMLHRTEAGVLMLELEVLKLKESTIHLIELISTDHTYVNDPRASNQLLHPYGEIRIGSFRFIYTDNEHTPFDDDESLGIRIDALNLKK